MKLIKYYKTKRNEFYTRMWYTQNYSFIEARILLPILYKLDVIINKL